jgi:hypothetical protein
MPAYLSGIFRVRLSVFSWARLSPVRSLSWYTSGFRTSSARKSCRPGGASTRPSARGCSETAMMSSRRSSKAPATAATRPRSRSTTIASGAMAASGQRQAEFPFLRPARDRRITRIRPGCNSRWNEPSDCLSPGRPGICRPSPGTGRDVDQGLRRHPDRAGGGRAGHPLRRDPGRLDRRGNDRCAA